MSDTEAAMQRTANNLKAILHSLNFEPEFCQAMLGPVVIVNHTVGYFLFMASDYNEALQAICKRHPSIAEETVDDRLRETIHQVLDEAMNAFNFTWNEPLNIGEQLPGFVHPDQLLSAANGLIHNLEALVRDYVVFVPLMGVELSMPQYDFGPVTLFRTTDSPPGMQSDEESIEFRYVHKEVRARFASAPSTVRIHVTGDTEFARQEGLRQATLLAVILNLHLGKCSTPRSEYERISAANLLAPNVTLVLARTDLPDDTGAVVPTYLHGTRLHGYNRQTLNITLSNEIKQSGFDVVWRCLMQNGTSSKTLSERIRRAVIWFDKAINFPEPDAQFVGLATALEILFVSKPDITNPFSTWSGITQQLADRCAYLLGHDLKSTMDTARDVKKLYGIRSKIMHEGGQPNDEELIQMIELTSRVIIDFVQRGFTSFEAFEDWIRRLHYSVNLSEIERTK